MDEMYAAGIKSPTIEATREALKHTTAEDVQKVAEEVEGQATRDTEEVMVLQKWNGKLLAEGFHLPEMEIEIERAVEQVESAIQSASKADKKAQ